MSKPHLYSSYEIANAVNTGWGVDDHLRNNVFVKLSEYDEKVDELLQPCVVMYRHVLDDREDNQYLRQRVDQLEREKAALEEQLNKAIQAQECWIPCSLRLPPYGESVFVRGSQGDEVRFLDTVDDTDEYSGAPIHYDCWFKEYEVDGDPYYFLEFDEVKYWMPKPKDPENDKKEDNHV